jgi:hypothetical protein
MSIELPPEVRASPADFAVKLRDQSIERFRDFTHAAWLLAGSTPAPPATSDDFFRALNGVKTSTIDSENRRRDAERTCSRLGLRDAEAGERDALVMVHATCVAQGFVRLLYGDHGPYVELMCSNIRWPLFRDHVAKGPRRHYHEHVTHVSLGEAARRGPDARDFERVQLYDQFNGVQHEPNPPPGEWAFDNNRAEGYASYVPGRIYLSADTVTAVVPFTAGCLPPETPDD